MKKYNLSKIMKRAWEMVKTAGFGISEALKKAWKEAKETMMKGTEKQITFAKDLMETMTSRFTELLSACPEQHKEMWTNITSGITAIMNESYAGDVIETLLRKDDKDFMSYYKALYVTISNKHNVMTKRIMAEVYNK